MRALHSLLALAAVLLPAPALADVTARYTAGPGKLTVEAADNGDWRITIDGPRQVTIIHVAAGDFVKMPDKDGIVRTARAEDAFAALLAPSGLSDAPAGTYMSKQVGTDSVAGFSGIRWTYGPAGEDPVELLVSADPRLALVGVALRRLADLILAVSGNTLGPDVLRPILAGGTPLRISTAGRDQSEPLIQLDSVATDPIDPGRFGSWGPVLSGKQFAALVAPTQENPPLAPPAPRQ
jgi:hypothetical protein